MLLPHGTGHVIADFPADAAAAKKKAVPFEQWLVQTESRTQPDNCETEVLCGKYWLDCGRMHPLMAELPEVVHLPSRVGSHLELRAAGAGLGERGGVHLAENVPQGPLAGSCEAAGERIAGTAEARTYRLVAASCPFGGRGQ